MLTVAPVTGPAERDAFIRLPGQLAAGDPNWVEPLMFERRMFLNPAKNPFFDHAEVALFLARRDGRPVGRISAQIDRLAPAVDGRVLGYFGMLAAEHGPETLAALFGAAESWLTQRGVGVIRGPFDLAINQTSGLLVEGFDTPPAMLMAHDAPWLGAAVEAQGYAPVKDLLAYSLVCANGLPERARKLAERSSGEVRIRSIDMRRYRDEIRTMTAIFNDAWSENWGFTPLTGPEIEAMADEMRPIIDRRLVKIGELNGEPIGFIVLLPNVNEAIAGLGGRLMPFGWLKLLWRLKVSGVRTARVPLMGVRRDHAGTMLGKTLPLRLIWALERGVLDYRFREIELSWLLDDNLPMRRMVEMLGCHRTKTWRIYQKRPA